LMFVKVLRSEILPDFRRPGIFWLVAWGAVPLWPGAGSVGAASAWGAVRVGGPVFDLWDFWLVTVGHRFRVVTALGCVDIDTSVVIAAERAPSRRSRHKPRSPMACCGHAQ
jgi:hypothetical protein